MLECNQIDGLMMDWLYDELDPASAARVADHVEACDRCTAEAGAIRRTREAFQSLSDAEPPAAVSAILLHEAARRAPAAAAEAHARPAAADSPSSSGSLGQRLRAWLRPLFLHPAAAAVCTLVLVAGVAGTLYVRHGWDMMREQPHHADQAAPVASGEGRAPAVATTRGEATLVPSDERDEPAPTTADGDHFEAAAKVPADRSGVLDLDDHSRAAAPATATADKGIALAGDQKPNGYSTRLLDDKRQREVEKASAGASRHLSWHSSSQPKRVKLAQPGSANRRFAERKATGAGPVANAVSGADPLVDGEELGRAQQGHLGGGGRGRVVAPNATARSGAAETTGLGNGAAAPDLPHAGTGKEAPQAAQAQVRRQTQPAPDDDRAPSFAAPPPSKKAGAARDVSGGQVVGGAQPAQGHRSRPLSPAELRWLATEEVNLARAVKSRKCPLAARIANDIRDRYSGYYARQVASSKNVASCHASVASETRRRAMVRAKQAARARAGKGGAAGVSDKAKAAPAKDEAASRPASR